MRNSIIASVSALALLGLVGCSGGGKKEDFATKLSYTAPTSSNYRFVQVAGNNGNPLVLELRGPAALSGRGVNFTLVSDAAKTDIVKVNSADKEFTQAGEVFNLGSEPHLFKAALTGSNTLRVSMAQKGPGGAATFGDRALARVAISLRKNQSKGTVSLTASAASILPATGEPTAITIDLGTVTAE
jgi:hypothetical protein